MNKTLTFSSLMTLALIISACSTAPQTKKSGLEGISEIDLFADRMVATIGPGQEIMVAAVEKLALAGKTDAALALLGTTERALGWAAGTLNLSNFKALLDNEKVPLTKEMSLKFIAESPFRADINATLDKNTLEQVAAIKRIGQTSTSGQTALTASTQQKIQAINLLKKQNTTVARDFYRLEKAGLPNTLDIAKINETCATLNTSSQEGLSTAAAANFTSVNHEVVESELQVFKDNAVQDVETCALNVGGATWAQQMQKMLKHMAKNIKKASTDSYQSCNLQAMRLWQAIQGLSDEKILELATAPAVKNNYLNQFEGCGRR
ncbi:MAG: hypothetical protein JST80_00350 [Bdellovibrionales bacterium]|nr:hypothetical protein [Bdellovibrionales bacterium]